MTDKELLTEEYKHLWSYYHRLLDERKNLFDWYIKIVGLPLGLIGFFLAQKSDQITLLPETGSVLLLIIFLVGASLFGTYAKESSNAAKYHSAMVAIREHINEIYPELNDAIVIDKLRKVGQQNFDLGGTALWRIMPLVFINSSILVASIYLLQFLSSIYYLIFLYVISVGCHLIIYKFLYVMHKR